MTAETARIREAIAVHLDEITEELGPVLLTDLDDDRVLVQSEGAGTSVARMSSRHADARLVIEEAL